MSEQAYGETYRGSREDRLNEGSGRCLRITGVVEASGRIDILVRNTGVQIIYPLELYGSRSHYLYGSVPSREASVGKAAQLDSALGARTGELSD